MKGVARIGRVAGWAAVFSAVHLRLVAQAWVLDAAAAPVIVNDNSAADKVAFAPLADGRVLAYGALTHVDGHATQGLGMLGPGGRAEPGFSSGVTSAEEVSVVAPLRDGRIIVVLNANRLSAPGTLGMSGASTGVRPLEIEARTSTVRRYLADGRPDASFAKLDCDGSPSLTPMPDGRVLIWGAFSKVGDVPRNSLARLNADGTLDLSYAPSVAAVPVTIASADAAPDGTVFASYYASPPGRFEPAFARFDAEGRRDPRFAPEVGRVSPLVVAQGDGSVLAVSTTLIRYTPSGAIDGGFDLRIPGRQSIVRVARLSNHRLAVEATVAPAGYPAVYVVGSDGSVETDLQTLPGATRDQRLLGILADGRMLVLQDATGAVPLTPAGPRIAAASPTAITPFGSGLVERTAANVSQIETDASGRAVMAGRFTHIDGQPRPGLARFLANGALDREFAPATRASLILVPPDGRPIVRAEAYQRLRDDGSPDPKFRLPAGLDLSDLRFHLGAPDGRLLISTFAPTRTSEADLKLFWLGETGEITAELPARFGGFGVWVVTVQPAGGISANTTTLTGTIVTRGSAGEHFVVDNPIWAAQLLPDGRLVLTGSFLSVDGVERFGVVWLKADGTVDAPKPTPIGPSSRAIPASTDRPFMRPLPDGRVLVIDAGWDGRRFNTVVSRLLTDGSRDAGFQHPINTFSHNTRPLSDGALFSDGRRFSTDGVLDRHFAPEIRRDGAAVSASVVAATGKYLWVGGGFNQVDGQPRTMLARFETREIVGIARGPRSQTVPRGREAVFEVLTGTARAATYQWSRNGVPIPGATDAVLRVPAVRPGDAGEFTVAVTIAGITGTSAVATLTVAPNHSRLTNFSAVGMVTSDTPQVAGFICADVPPRTVFLRAIGYRTGAAGAPPRLRQPLLSLFERERLLGENLGTAPSSADATLGYRLGTGPYGVDGTITWGSTLFPSLGAGVFTTTVRSGNSLPGTSLLEFYDSGSVAAPPLLRNLSIRSQIGSGPQALNIGFVVTGNGPVRLLIRGLGPVLGELGVAGAIAEPRLALFRRNDDRATPINGSTAVAEISAATQHVGAFPLPPGGQDVAVLLLAEPGDYTAQLINASGAAGVGMVEIHVIDPD